MTLHISPETIEEIRRRVNIADVAAEFVQLKRSGRSQTARCPFHGEKTPSFHVHEEEGYFKCFGCGKHGDAFTLLMELRGLSFAEAASYLAQRLGITIKQSPQAQQASSQTKFFRQVMEAAAHIYRTTLADAEKGRPGQDYFSSRGISAETQSSFGLGFAPASWEFIVEALRARLSQTGLALPLERAQEVAQILGLVKAREGANFKSQGAYDVFRERVIFPILAHDGSVLALGGRIIRPSEDAPKYLNSVESPLYKKRMTLFGLPQALDTLRRERTAVIVEGYLDVLSLHQAGIKNVVATCGTALTEEHARVLRRIVDRAVVLFDGDTAGRKAAAFCFEQFINSGVELEVVFTPEGEDPDSLVRKSGVNAAQAVKDLLSRATVPAIEAFLEFSLAANPANQGVAAAGRVAQQLAGILTRINNPVERELLLQRGAQKLLVSPRSLTELLELQHQRTSSGTSKTPKKFANNYAARNKANTASYLENIPLESYATEFALDQESVAGEKESITARARLREDYFRQLTLALVCEPKLAQGIRQQIARTGEPAGEMPLPEHLLSLLGEIERKKLEGIATLLSLGWESAAAQEILQSWREALEAFGLGAEELLAEAKQLLSVGGLKPSAVVNDLGRFAAFDRLSKEVHNLRSEESASGEQEEKIWLAQQKLIKLRDLDRVRKRLSP